MPTRPHLLTSAALGRLLEIAWPPLLLSGPQGRATSPVWVFATGVR